MKIVHTIKKIASSRLQLVLALGILALGILVMIILVKLRKQPQRKEQKIPAPLVKVEELSIRDIQMVVSGYGTVRAKVEVEVVPQVSGKVVWVNPEFKSGGFIRADEQLLKIDPRDYELAVRQGQAVVAEAEVNLEMEKAEAEVASDEWEQLHPNTTPTSTLVLRGPQIRQAQARLESAKAQLETTKLNLERTSLSLPIDVLIVSETVDIGQYVVAGKSLGMAYGIDAVEIELPLEDRELAWFDVPGNNASFNAGRSSSKITTAEVKADFAGAEHMWRGYVRRTTGQVDKTSRLISVVIEVVEPFSNLQDKPPMLPGMFVEVFIKGNVLKNAVAVPRDAIHNGNEVWVVKYSQSHIKALKMVRLGVVWGAVLIGGNPLESFVSIHQRLEHNLSEEWITPYGRFRVEGLTPPWLAGVFAGVLVGADFLETLTEVTQHIIYEAWVLNNGKLHIQPLEIVRADKDFAYVTSGLEDETMIVTSTIDVVTEAMSVRIKR